MYYVINLTTVLSTFIRPGYPVLGETQSVESHRWSPGHDDGIDEQINTNYISQNTKSILIINT